MTIAPRRAKAVGKAKKAAKKKKKASAGIFGSDDDGDEGTGLFDDSGNEGGDVVQSHRLQKSGGGLFGSDDDSDDGGLFGEEKPNTSEKT